MTKPNAKKNPPRTQIHHVGIEEGGDDGGGIDGAETDPPLYWFGVSVEFVVEFVSLDPPDPSSDTSPDPEPASTVSPAANP